MQTWYPLLVVTLLQVNMEVELERSPFFELPSDAVAAGGVEVRPSGRLRAPCEIVWVAVKEHKLKLP